MCQSCPLKNGNYPEDTVLYRLAVKHLALLNIELAPARDTYTERQIMAILTVYAERERLKAERMKEPHADH